MAESDSNSNQVIPDLWVETVTSRIGPHILASNLRPATQADLQAARELHAAGKCPHNVVRDTYGWLYDFRSCAVCGQGLGTV